jgi:hypothetical protein
MKTRLALAVGLLAASGAAAAPVRVTSGEHRDFTRVVLQFEGATPWEFGRTMDGYALRVPGLRPDYDLAKAFDLIGKARLAALAPDRETGDLDLGIACACHAVPFEFRPGIVVIDLYDGPPDAGSAFENPLPILTAAEIPAAAPPEPAKEGEAALSVDPEALIGGYDWTRVSLEQMGLSLGEPPQEARTLPKPTSEPMLLPDIDALRNGLVEQLGAGATAGMIELAPSEGKAEETRKTPEELLQAAEVPTETAPTKAPEAPAAGIEVHGAAEGDEGAEALKTTLGDVPDLVIRDVGDKGKPLTAEGKACVPDEQVDLLAWGSDRPVVEQLGPIRQGMVGEFDKPSEEAVRRVVRFYIYIGFGAEARAILRAYPDLLPEAPVFEAMAALLDGQPVPNESFRGMEDCDASVALWAVLAEPEVLPKDEVGRAAVARTFSALPPALRRLLGPRLVDAYLEAKDVSMAMTLADAVLRSPGEKEPEIIMMEADIERARGHDSLAEAKLEPIVAAPGPSSTDALVDLVEHRASLGQSVKEEDVLTLEAALKERAGSTEEGRYRRALVLAKAASGNFDAAFAEAEDPKTLAAIWRLLGQNGGDTPLLNHATLAEGQPPPPEAVEAAGIISNRLLTLGLADQAARWIVLAPRVPALLQAKIALANGEATRALELIAEETSEQALHLRAEALLSLGDEAGAAKVYQELGKTDRQTEILTTAQDWSALPEDQAAEWRKLLQTEEGPAPPDEPTADPQGPLAANRALVDESASTRDAILNLLNSVQVPQPASQ